MHKKFGDILAVIATCLSEADVKQNKSLVSVLRTNVKQRLYGIKQLVNQFTTQSYGNLAKQLKFVMS